MWSLGSTSRVIVFSARILTKICIHLSGEEQGEVLTLFGCCSCLKLFPGEDESLLIPPRDAFFVLNLFFDTVAWFNLKSDGLFSLVFTKNCMMLRNLYKQQKLSLFNEWRRRERALFSGRHGGRSWHFLLRHFIAFPRCVSPSQHTFLIGESHRNVRSVCVTASIYLFIYLFITIYGLKTKG